jgi:DNA-binding Lrp family transcriptional regulator
MGFFLSQEIAQLIEREARPMNYREISEKLGIKAHVTTAVLRGLAGDQVVEKSGAGWKIKILKK